jgi:hypothetical protein
MKKTYYIVHDYEAAKRSIDGQMYPFDEDKEEHEYSCFPATLLHRNLNEKISMTSQPADGKKGLIVTLSSSLTEEDMIAALDHVLVCQNKDIKGLCLVATRLD